uniref:TIMELESS-interacting protein n=1 Tax=Timema tahoe TaxID=61484 RepID=A0A7R9ICZ8_9NEOP|nr:unnamed protein product [Timema tahoe]
MLEDIYRDDLIGDPNDLEEIIEGDLDDPQNEDNDNQDEIAGEGNQPDPTGTPVEPKKRKVLRPQPKLNAERLKGPRGIATLENVFKDFKFQGKGYEKHDLDRVMNQMKHWAHRLYPRFQFDDCLEKIEKLGHKKPLQARAKQAFYLLHRPPWSEIFRAGLEGVSKQDGTPKFGKSKTYVKKIRMGLETSEEPMNLIDDDDNITTETFTNDDLQPPVDAFDELLSQQLLEMRARQTPQPPVVSQHVLQQQPVVLTAEQKERMLRNRLMAEERRLARLKAQQDKSKNSELDIINHKQVTKDFYLDDNPSFSSDPLASWECIMHEETSRFFEEMEVSFCGNPTDDPRYHRQRKADSPRYQDDGFFGDGLHHVEQIEF